MVTWPSDSDEFRAVNAAGKQAGVVARYRSPSSTVWTYSAPHGRFPGIWLEAEMGEHILQMTAARAKIELAMPEALDWNEEQRFARPTASTNVTVTTTHDSLTVSWDRQPLSQTGGLVTLRSPDHHSLDRSFQDDGQAERHEVTFGHLPPDTEYEAIIGYFQPDIGNIITNNTWTSHTARTAPAPAGWQAPLRGPQNLRASATRNSVTVNWDHPIEGAEEKYLVRIFETSTGTMIDSRSFHDGTTSWTTQGRLWWVVRGFSYRIHVLHRAIPEAEATIIVTAPSDDGS